MSDAPLVITGHAYGRAATLEVAGDTLVWRARRVAPENIATTVHDVRSAHVLQRRWSAAGIAITVWGVLWLMAPSFIGFGVIPLGLAIMVWRWCKPRQFLVLGVGDRRLMLRIAGSSAGPSRALVERIHHARATGEVPIVPSPLP